MGSPRDRRAFFGCCAHSLLAGLLIAVIHLTGLTLALDRRNYDLWFQLSPTSDMPAEHVAIVEIDDRSLRELGGWPWPSRRLAELLRKIDEAAPVAVGLDVLLDRPRDRETDPELGKALAEMGTVLVAANLRVSPGVQPEMEWPLPVFRVARDRVGFSNAVADRTDGYIRSWRQTVGGGDGTLYSLPLALATAAFGQRGAGVRVDGNWIRLPQEVGGRTHWPLVSLIDFRRTDQIPTVSAADIFAGSESPEALSGRVVLVGVTAAGKSIDFFGTPFSDDLVTRRAGPTRGVEVMANAVETLLSGVYLREMTPIVVAGIVLAFTVIACAMLRPLRPAWGLVVALIIVIGSAAACLALFISRHLQVPVTPFALGATAAYVVVALEKRAAAETQRRLAEHRNQLLRDLSAMVTHDLHGPLTSIRGFLDLLSRERLDERQREFVQIAMGSTRWLSVLITGILDVAKMEAGQVTIHREPLDLGHEIEQALVAVSYQLLEKDLRMEVTVEADLPSVPADSELFRRIVVNLVGNAAKFAPMGSAVELQAYREGERDAVVVSVQDHGPGVAREYQERIFDKFVQVADGKSAQKISVGLGLAFCRLAVEAHGGGIWVESEPGSGARFSFWLPLHAAGSSTRRRRKPDVPVGERR